MRWTVVAAVLLLINLGYAVSAECAGNLEISDIDDVTVSGSDTYNIEFDVKTDEETYNSIRNIDVRLYDPDEKVVAQKNARFDLSDRDTTMNFYFKSNGELLDGRYRVRAEMRVFYQNDTASMKCGKIEYGNYFDINTGRSDYDQQPFKLDLDVAGVWNSFDVRKRNCTQSYCVQVNMTGMKPANMTIDPKIELTTPQDQTSMSISTDVCYPGSFLIKLMENNTQSTRSLSECNDKILGLSDRLEKELATSQKGQADMLTRFDECMKANTEFNTYRTSHPYTVEEIAIPSIFVGMVLLFIIIAWYNRRGHRDSPQEMVK